VPELQRLQAGHAAAVLAFELANRAYFAAFISDRGDEFFDQFPERHSALLAEQDAGIGAFYVLAAEDGSVLGRFNLIFAGDGTAELGYRVAQHVAGRGVATATVRELCRLAAARHGLRTLRTATSSGNIASQKVLTKAGFVPVSPADPAHLGGKPGTWYQRDLTRDPDPSPASPPATAERVWAGLGQPWQEAFRRWSTWRTNSEVAARCGASPPWTSPRGSGTCGPTSRN
jgi:ribosomal-protein-alanine N-acetyltransferase